MFVLSVCESLLHGGAETVLVDLVRGLTAHRHQVAHFTRAHGATPVPWIVEALRDASVPCHDTQASTLADPSARRNMFGAEPDIVLFHWWGNNTFRPWPVAADDAPGTARLGLAPASSGRPRFVIVIHNTRYQAPPGYDTYVLVSPRQRPQVEGIDPSRVAIVPNGVDLSRFHPCAVTVRSRAGLPPNETTSADTDSGAPSGAHPGGRPFTIGRISALNEKKIPRDWVVTAAGYALEDVRFVIAGEGPLRAALEDDARRLGVDDRFVFPGYVAKKDVPALLSTFDVFCHVGGSAAEACPLALLEACAAGVPIVSEPRGGIPDIVRHGENGLLAAGDDVAAALRLLRDDGAMRRRLARGAHLTARELSVERQAAAYGRLLQSETYS
ncbi:MAG: glycosyltransferase family 4 protein [Vicinamibacterales bacterium]